MAGEALAEEAVKPRGSDRLPRSGIGGKLEVLLLAIACGALVLLFVQMLRVGLNRFDSGWDFVAYHLPFGIKLFAPSQLTMHPLFEELFKGVPLALHMLIGGLWSLHPLVPLNLTHMVGTLFLAIFVAITAVRLRWYAVMFAMLALSSPLVLIHSVSGYIDLPGNLLVLGALISIHRLQENSSYDCSVPWVMFGLICLGLCGASKYTLLPLAMTAAIIFSITIFSGRRFNRRTSIVIALVAIILSAGWSIRNTVLHDNPIYPLKVPLIGDLLPHAWDMPTSAKDRPLQYVGTPQPLVTLASILELDDPQLERGQPRYTVDQAAGGPGGPAHRMGGFWPTALALLIALVSLSIWRGYMTRGELMPFLLLVLLTLFLPQSHELRYYQFIPLTLAYLAAWGVSKSPIRWERAGALALSMCVACTSWALNSSHLRGSPESVEQVAQTLGVDLAAIPVGSVICGKSMGLSLTLLTGPSLRENQVLWRGRNEICPAGSIEVVGNGPYPY